MVARIRFSATWIVDARSGQIRRATGCSKFQEKLQEFQYVRNYNWFARPSIVNSQISAVGCWYVLAQCCQWKKRNNYNYTSYWCLCIIGRNPYTVDREIFAVKIFSSLVIATKIRHVKIWHAMLYQLHGWGSNKNYLTWKFYRRKFPDLRISCTLALQLHTYVEQIEGRTLTNWVNFTHYIIQNAHLVYRGYMYQAARNACACLLT